MTRWISSCFRLTQAAEQRFSVCPLGASLGALWSNGPSAPLLFLRRLAADRTGCIRAVVQVGVAIELDSEKENTQLSSWGDAGPVLHQHSLSQVKHMTGIDTGQGHDNLLSNTPDKTPTCRVTFKNINVRSQYGPISQQLFLKKKVAG